MGTALNNSLSYLDFVNLLNSPITPEQQLFVTKVEKIAEKNFQLTQILFHKFTNMVNSLNSPQHFPKVIELLEEAISTSANRYYSMKLSWPQFEIGHNILPANAELIRLHATTIPEPRSSGLLQLLSRAEECFHALDELHNQIMLRDSLIIERGHESLEILYENAPNIVDSMPADMWAKVSEPLIQSLHTAKATEITLKDSTKAFMPIVTGCINRAINAYHEDVAFGLLNNLQPIIFQ